MRGKILVILTPSKNLNQQPNCACRPTFYGGKNLVIPTSRKNFNQQPNRACRTSIDEWKTTPWCNIDVENMDIDCKKFSKVKRGRCTIIINNRLQKVLKGEKRRSSNLFPHQDLRSLDKSMRDWHAYKGLETTVKNFFLDDTLKLYFWMHKIASKLYSLR